MCQEVIEMLHIPYENRKVDQKISKNEIRIVHSSYKPKDGWVEIDYNNALKYYSYFKYDLGTWAIVKAGNGSFDGSGYSYRHRPNEERGLGEKIVWKPPPTDWW